MWPRQGNKSQENTTLPVNGDRRELYSLLLESWTGSWWYLIQQLEQSDNCTPRAQDPKSTHSVRAAAWKLYRKYTKKHHLTASFLHHSISEWCQSVKEDSWGPISIMFTPQCSFNGPLCICSKTDRATNRLPLFLCLVGYLDFWHFVIETWRSKELWL